MDHCEVKYTVFLSFKENSLLLSKKSPSFFPIAEYYQVVTHTQIRDSYWIRIGVCSPHSQHPQLLELLC